MATKLVDMALLAQYDSKLKELANLLQRKYVYAVNDVVYYNNVKLKCITAGTTSDRAIASPVTVGTMVTDGTVVWKVLDQNDIGVLIEDWAVTTDYELKDLVIYNNIIYRCKTAHTSSSTFDLTKWDALTLDTLSIKLWESSATYAINDLVIESEKVYICVANHTASSSFATDKANWKLLNDIGTTISDWASGVTYKLKDLVIRNNTLYRCKVAHTSTTTFENNKWDTIGSGSGGSCLFEYDANGDLTPSVSGTQTSSGGGIEPWVTNKPYHKDNIVVYASQIYKCTTDHVSTSFTSDMASWELVSGVQLWKENTFYAQNQLVYVNSDMYICMVAHTSSNDFLLDLETNYWQAVVKIDAELIPANYLQVTKIDLADNSIVDIKMPKTLTFCIKPPNILKFNPSADIEIVTQNEFDSSDKGDFEYDKNYVVFDGTMHIKSDLGVNTSTAEKLVDGYVSVSDTINFAEYKSVSGVKVG